ncbi:hypothetical protein [Liquorilactobacillus satsumensis]|uniref:Uncharacterized protein n=1 Tax=Liquorilactobacillus satsumensis DSM 16230 = JCM 12392 TaxID=1423801 RepID=A0A0R1V3B6_9LACO|nr:hypothetical protein [Liquorilactobacillus satsumensis]KRL97253.1 hypothetical protein FD50_GL001811 [Liquorilactobacillus satsumensis DSM 16230 = JCM 12392]
MVFWTKQNGKKLENKNELKFISKTDKDILNKQLHEITDSAVLDEITSLSPSFAGLLTKNIPIGNNKNGLYEVVIQKGETLVKAHGDGDYLGGFVQGKNGKIKSQALLKEAKQPKALSTANVMNVASMVVGQYYMTEISSKMDDLNSSITEIKESQQSEFKSKIRALIVNLKDCARFSVEILNDVETRTVHRNTLMNYRDTATQLMEQVNDEISFLLTNSDINKFDGYLKKVNELKALLFFQQSLLSILKEIGRLSLLFSNKNGIGQGYFNVYNEYLNKTNQIFENIKEWHTKEQDEYDVDLKHHRYSKQGIVGKLFGLAAKVNEEWQYEKINLEAEKLIQHQRNLKNIEPEEVTLDLFTQDTKLLLKDNKVYYLP